MVTLKERLLVACPSVARSVMVAKPKRLGAGVTLTVRLLGPEDASTMFAGGTRTGSEETAVTLRLFRGESTSSSVNGNSAVEPSSLMVWSAMGVMDGGALAEVTVSRKGWLVVVVPSPT